MADLRNRNPGMVPLVPSSTRTSVQPTEGDVYGIAYLARQRGRGGATFGRAVQGIIGASPSTEAALWQDTFLAIRGDDAGP
jgi:hypothetical protein